ncbi:MAG TPA: hypothetical protein VKR22_04610 [Acidimicrobiales bacterium]|nr:hypothetical protein [Acidimicrobiales bacterium]
MAGGDTDLTRVRHAITKLIQDKYLTGPRAWTDIEAIRYRNLCELEQALQVVDGLESAAS